TAPIASPLVARVPLLRPPHHQRPGSRSGHHSRACRALAKWLHALMPRGTGSLPGSGPPVWVAEAAAAHVFGGETMSGPMFSMPSWTSLAKAIQLYLDAAHGCEGTTRNRRKADGRAACAREERG